MIDELLSAIGAKDIAEIGETMVSIVGTRLVAVSNMQGLLSLSDEEIRFKGEKGKVISVFGEFLVVKEFNKNDIVVSGRISGVKFGGVER